MGNLEIIQADWEWAQETPIAPAVRAGDFLYLAGVISVDGQGEVVGEGDMKAQARQIFANIKQVLESAGADLGSVVRLTNYFALPLDQGIAKDYWTVRREVFGDRRLASTGVQVVSLIDPKLMLEIDTIAYAPTSDA